MMRVLDLFSGIGAFSLGLERAGMTTAAFCEIDPYCRRVLANHWPEVPCYDDVRSLTAERLGADGISVDVICGGFPCQDISVAGRGAGIGGERSGLWREFARIIGEVGPRYVLVENVAALLSRGLGDVLGDLATLGYDAEWHCIPAAAVGAPHRRDRVWIVAYANRQCPEHTERYSRDARATEWNMPGGCCADVADAAGDGWCQGQPPPDARSDQPRGERKGEPCRIRADVADASGAGQPQQVRSSRPILDREALQPAGQDGGGWYPWLVEPDVGRVASRVANRVDRLRGLGNSLVPQIPELIGRAILEQAA